MMKHLFKPIFLVLALFLPIVASAYDFEVDGIYYNKNGTEASVTFKDTNYNSYRDTVNIPNTVTYLDTTYTVTRVGSRAFENCSALRRVTFPNSITEIEYRGFYNCTMLSNVSFPSSLSIIGSYAFQNCTRISSPSLNRVTTIGYRAFYNTGTWYVYLNQYQTSIGTQAFGHCYIWGINVASNNPVYDSRDDCEAVIETATNTIILGCQYTKIPNTVTAIGDESFDGCEELSELIIPNSVTYIGSWAFLECTNLRNLVIPNSVTTIKNSAFCYCYSLDNVVIPFSVTELGVGAFYGCHSLSKITIPYTITRIGDATFADCYGLTSVTIPNSITAIDERAFQNCRNLTSIDIPNTVTSLGKQAFLGCEKLKDITIPESVTSIGESVFSNCFSLKHITLSKNITEIPRWAFNSCRALSSIDLHEGITTIGYSSFSGCESLTNVTIPSTVTVLDAWSFSDCKSIKSLIFNAVNCTIGSSSMYGTIDNFQIGDGVEHIPVNLFSLNFGDKLLVLPNSVKVIDSNSLKGTAGGVVIGDNIEEIGAGAFTNGISVAYVTSSTPRPCSPGAFVNPQTLYVPSGSRSRYLDATGWNEFANIIEQDYIRVTDITLDNNQITLQKGATQQLNATILPSNASNQSLNWISDDESIAIVSADGLVTATGPGETDIMVMADNIRVACHVTVPATLVQSITINHDHLSMTIGETASLMATVSPEIADEQYIEWIFPENEILMIQETNDNTLDIAALHKGRVAITARTTDGSNLSVTCMVTVLDAGGEDAFYMSDMSALHGDTITIPVAMSSTEPIFAFQTDIYLPDGLFIVTNDGGDYMVTPSGRMTSDHVLMTSDTGDGGVRVMCYSPNEQTFDGDNGEDLFYITVAVSNDAVGEYVINLRNSLLTTNLFQELSVPDISATIDVKAFLPGDANDSRTVTVTDIVVTAMYVLNQNPSPFIFEAADMNNDGNVTVTDIMLIAHLILYPSPMNAPRLAPAFMVDCDSMSGDAISLMPGETRTVSIELNNQMTYSAFQLDLSLPTGLTASNFALTDRAVGHAFDANSLEDGKVRALCYSPVFDAINGNSGTLLTFDVTATGSVMGNISVEGIELVTTDCQTVHFDGFTIGVNTPTAVLESSANVKVYSEGHNIIVELPMAATVNVSDIVGRTTSLNLNAGRNVIPANNGVHIVTVNGQSTKLLLR